jgi:hypothetical protein
LNQTAPYALFGYVGTGSEWRGTVPMGCFARLLLRGSSEGAKTVLEEPALAHLLFTGKRFLQKNV